MHVDNVFVNSHVDLNTMSNKIVKYKKKKKRISIQTTSNIIIKVGDCNVTSVNCVQNLGAYFDSIMSMKEFVSHKCKSVQFQLRKLLLLLLLLNICQRLPVLHLFKVYTSIRLFKLFTSWYQQNFIS